MNSLSNFLLTLGIYNFIGSIFLLGFLSNQFGNYILTKQFRIFKNPYNISSGGFLWLVWTIVLNLFFSVINMLAFRWDELAQTDILLVDLFVYTIFFVLSIFACFSKNYSIGIYFNFPIFLFWIIWGLFLV